MKITSKIIILLQPSTRACHFRTNPTRHVPHVWQYLVVPVPVLCIVLQLKCLLHSLTSSIITTIPRFKTKIKNSEGHVTDFLHYSVKTSFDPFILDLWLLRLGVYGGDRVTFNFLLSPQCKHEQESGDLFLAKQNKIIYLNI